MTHALPLRRIVVGVDGSAASAAAVRWAVREARLRRAAVHLVCAYHGDATLHAVRLIVLDGALASAPCRGQGGARSRHRSRQPPPPAGPADRRAGRRAARPGAARPGGRCRDAGPGIDPARAAAGAATPGHGPGGARLPAPGALPGRRRRPRPAVGWPGRRTAAREPWHTAASDPRPCPPHARAARVGTPGLRGFLVRFRLTILRPGRRQPRLAGFPAVRSPSRSPTSTTVSASQTSRSATGISSRFCGACGPPVSTTTRLRAMPSRWQGRQAAGHRAACGRRPRRRRQGTRSAGHGG